jgi:hypothetical protein
MMKAVTAKAKKQDESRAAAHSIFQKKNHPEGAKEIANNRPGPAADRLTSVPHGPAGSSKFIRLSAPSQVFSTHPKEIIQRNVIQFTLSQELQLLIEASNKSYKEYLTIIQNSDTEERIEAHRNKLIMQGISTCLSSDEALAISGALMEGISPWRQAGQTSFYAEFMSAEIYGRAPDLNKLKPKLSSMNCWESVLYALYKLNRIDEHTIAETFGYNLASSELSLPEQSINTWEAVGFSNASLINYEVDVIPTGKFVYYVPEGKAYPEHIALSLGNGKAISLWDKPDNNKFVQTIDIDILLIDTDLQIFISDSPY